MPHQIITGFLGTAWLVVLILVVYFVVFYDPTLDPFAAEPNKKLPRPNPIDMSFYKAKLWLIRPLDKLEKRHKRFSSFRRRLRSRVGRDVFVEVCARIIPVPVRHNSDTRCIGRHGP